MAPSTPATRRYAAFISYSHKDNREENRRWANWVQDLLESYEVPRNFHGQKNKRGEPIPRMIFPVFRDESELAADSDLQNSIRQALENSQHLIVICSPRAVASDYVAEEIRHFKELGKADRIIGLLVEGEPGDPRHECLPQPFRLGRMSAQGVLDWTAPAEPICADVRLPGAREQGYTTVAAFQTAIQGSRSTTAPEIQQSLDDYRERLDSARLKLIAGVLGVPLGDLIRSDNKFRLARLRRAVAIGLSVAAALLALAATSVFFYVLNQQAILAKAKAESETDKAKLVILQERQASQLAKETELVRAAEQLVNVRGLRERKQFAAAKAAVDAAVIIPPSQAELRPLFADRIVAHEAQRQQLLESIRSAQDALAHEARLNRAFAEVVFLATPLILPGADKQADRARARRAAAQACQELPPLSAGVPDSTVLRDPASFTARLAYLHRAAQDENAPAVDLAGPNVNAFDRGLARLQETSSDPADEQQRYDDASQLFQDELQASPDHFWARFCLAAMQLRNRQPRAAEAGLSGCEGMLKLAAYAAGNSANDAPHSPWLYLLRGLARAQIRDFPRSRADLQEALRQFPADEAFGRYLTAAHLGDAYTREGKFPEAEAELQRALSWHSSGDATALFNAALNDFAWADDAHQRGDSTTAQTIILRGKQRLDQAILLNSANGEMRLTRGGLFHNPLLPNDLVTLDQALEDLEQAAAIESGPSAESSEALIAYAALLLSRARQGGAAAEDDARKALVHLELALQRTPADLNARLLRAGEVSRQAELLRPEGDLAERAERERMWRQVQNDAALVVYYQPPPSGDQRRIAWSLAARAEEARNNYRAAWNGYTEALAAPGAGESQLPPAAATQWRLRRGWVGLHHDVAQFDQSLADFQELAASKPDDPYLLTGAALAHLRLRQFAEAFAQMNQVLGLVHQHQTAHPEQQLDAEVLRRIQHAQADICVQIFNLQTDQREKVTKLTRTELVRKAEGGLREALLLTQAKDPRSLGEYWRLHIDSDPDLEPILRGPVVEELRKRFPASGSSAP